ncbi:MAG: hypothetical protein HC836_42575 [Richelia sp. RM2_1_2]|nr:hypothetical protein [Richelia sp. SM2_1_7]NJM19111.1 hypothetical protein [Richelia sp. SM1_7_0]NJN11386.1 hypothetical protein [Richelia sp. RM1_1_1]NJO28901.1 hypothetical protein [Richelia sp. SL_2_1]NJO64594.1 hypothetical protein [Richelia sp. RM2_1_2]
MSTQNNLFDISSYSGSDYKPQLTDPAWDTGAAFPKHNQKSLEEDKYTVGKRLWFDNCQNQCIVISFNPFKVRFWHGEEKLLEFSLFQDADTIEMVWRNPGTGAYL